MSKSGIYILSLLFLFSCIQKEKNLSLNVEKLSVATCDNSDIKYLFVYKEDSIIVSYRLKKDESNSYIIYLFKDNYKYIKSGDIIFNNPNTCYTIVIPKGDLVYEIELFTDQYGKIDSVCSYNLCK